LFTFAAYLGATISIGPQGVIGGLLAAAFYSPICTSALTEPRRFVIAVLAFTGLMFGKLPPWLVVLACALAGRLFLH
jgi:chromate transporter